jgi:PNKP (polynucleotide 5'-kinase/3'-phosphatase) family adenylyltransferase-like protein
LVDAPSKIQDPLRRLHVDDTLKSPTLTNGIIYGPEYTLPEHLERLRERGLSGKRSLALREFALGIEGLERFGQREPLRRIHECVFGVLALESEPVDPRL